MKNKNTELKNKLENFAHSLYYIFPVIRYSQNKSANIKRFSLMLELQIFVDFRKARSEPQIMDPALSSHQPYVKIK